MNGNQRKETGVLGLAVWLTSGICVLLVVFVAVQVGLPAMEEADRIAPTQGALPAKPIVTALTTPRLDKPIVTPLPTPHSKKSIVTQAQRESAQSIMDKVTSGLASVEQVEGDALVVRFEAGLLPTINTEQLYQLMGAIANADAALKGRSRHIDFYDLTGKRVGVASPLSGIRLER